MPRPPGGLSPPGGHVVYYAIPTPGPTTTAPPIQVLNGARPRRACPVMLNGAAVGPPQSPPVVVPTTAQLVRQRARFPRTFSHRLAPRAEGAPPAPPPAPARRPGRRVRLRTVDALRAVAVLMVVLVHSPAITPDDPLALRLLRPLQSVGQTGVSLFLVISGFSIHLRWARATPDERRRFSAIQFWKRRFLRLYPTYFASVLLVIGVFVALKGTDYVFSSPSPWLVRPGNSPGWFQLAAHTLVIGANVVPLKFLLPAWSLALEEQIYAAYVVVLKRVRRLHPLRLLAVALGITLAWRIGAQFVTPSVPVSDHGPTPLSTILYAQAPARVFEWVLGLVAAEAFVGNIALPRFTRRFSLGIAAVVAGGLLVAVPVGDMSLGGHAFHASDVVLDGLFGVGFFVCLYSLACRERDGRLGRLTVVVRPLAVVGLASYSIYLLHMMIVFFFANVSPGLPVPGPGRALYDVGMWAAVLVISLAFYWMVERRFVALASRVRPFRPSRTSVGASSPASPRPRLPLPRVPPLGPVEPVP